MFSYNCKTGNILMNDRHIVRWERCCGTLSFWIKDRGTKRYLVQRELAELAKTVKWLIEQRGCDFGEEVNLLAKQEYLLR